MRVDLLELLHCPAPHAPTPLVTIALARIGDRLQQGILGCPVCGAEYRLEHGALDLRAVGAAFSTPASRDRSDATIAHDRRERGTSGAVDPTRMAALLALSEPDMRVALCGSYAHVAESLEAMTQARCVAINASQRDVPHPGSAELGDSTEPFETMQSQPDSLLIAESGVIPVVTGALHAMAVDAHHAGLLADAVRAVRAGGRIVATASLSLPKGCRELARDAAEWVAVVEGAVSAPVTLRRGSAYGD